jgi:hypothetical protein
MEYRILDSDGREALDKLCALSGYYSPVETRKLGGIAVGAYVGERLVAGLWCALSGTRAYLDYLVADPEFSGAAVKCLGWLDPLLQSLGVEELHFDIEADNTTALRIARVFRAHINNASYTGYYPLGDNNG